MHWPGEICGSLEPTDHTKRAAYLEASSVACALLAEVCTDVQLTWDQQKCQCAASRKYL